MREREKSHYENLACPSTVDEGVRLTTSSRSPGIIIIFNTLPTCQEQYGLSLLFWLAFLRFLERLGVLLLALWSGWMSFFANIHPIFLLCWS